MKGTSAQLHRHTLDMFHAPLTVLTLTSFAPSIPLNLPLPSQPRLNLKKPRLAHRYRTSRMLSLPAAPVLQRTVDSDSAKTLDSLLADRKYHIEFNGYLSNHVKHALIALGGLQAPAEKIQQYHDFYTECTPYGFTLDPAEEIDKSATPMKDADWELLLGAKSDYPKLLQFFTTAVDKDGIDSVLKKYAPRLLEGYPGALTHGIIHLGWAIDAGHRDMIIEGLAYFTYCHVTVHPERFKSGEVQDETPLQSMLRIADSAQQEDLGQWVKETMEDPTYENVHPELKVAGFQRNVAKVIAKGHPLLFDLPVWLDTFSIPELFEALYRDVALLYLATAGQPSPKPEDHGNFLILHALTSLWALEFVTRSLPDDVVRHSIKCYWSGLSALLVAATGGAGIPTRPALAEVASAFPASAREEVQVEGQVWDEVVERALNEEEEHNIKLVYVSRELWRRYSHWPGYFFAAQSFTSTPNIGPGRSTYTV